jgi:hypothetical protein
MSSVKDAAQIIGDQPPNDYTLDLAAHPQLYKQNAPQLADLLGSSKIQAIRQKYADADAKAIAVQAIYKDMMKRANLAIFTATCLGALMMAVQIILGDRWPAPLLLVAIGIMSAIAGALGAIWLFQIKNGGMLDNWMRARAAAETQRLSYFAEVAAPSQIAQPDRDFNLLRLEYCRRYQLDVERIYYRVRGERHRVEADRTMSLGSYAVGLSALASLGTGVAGAVSGAATSLGIAGVFAGALASYANARESTSLDRRNAERYERSCAALDGVAARLDEVRAAVGQEPSNEQALTEFVRAINDQISLEHREWLEETKATKEAVAKLDEALGKIKPGGQKPDAAPAKDALPKH